MEYTIREIEARDNAVVERIIRACLVEFGANHDGTAWSDDLSRFSELYSDGKSRYWVAEDENGTVVGGVGIGALSDADGVCELQKMYCLPHARGRGAAHLLIERALAFASLHYTHCYLETTENMLAAQRFYEKHGFVRTYEPIASTDHFACDVRYIKKL